MVAGPLSGLRVLELATGVAGPYAGRLLAMLGATVVKAEPPGGDPARALASDDGPVQRPSPVFVHLNSGKRLVSRATAPAFTTAALRWADVVIDDETPVALPDPPLRVTVTAWCDGTRDPGGPEDELLIQAASGLLGASRDDTGHPLRFPGWQSQYLAGAYAAAGALAGLACRASSVSVSWLGAALSAVEAHAAGALDAATSARPDDPEEDRRHAGFLATYPSGVFPCADGFVIPGTVRPQDWVRQCDVYGRPELVYDPRFVWAHRWANRDLLRDELRPWYRARRRHEVFAAALEAGWAAAVVLTAGDALDDAHLRERRFLAPVSGATAATVPARPWRGGGIPEGVPVRLSELDGDRAWFEPHRPRRSPVPRAPAPDGLRVVELTWAWAGPLVGRFLGALGADVVRVEVGNRPDGWRTRHRLRDMAGPGADPDEYTWDAAAQFNSLNRSKRAISVDLISSAGAGVFRRLVSVADVLIVNMGHRVLADRGVDDHVRHEIERGLVVVEMPALGTSGPHRAMAGYGMLSEGMGGFAARYGWPGEGARASTTYYPDAVAGVHGVVAVLAALTGLGAATERGARRRRGGVGTRIDLSQQETMWLQLGDGLVLASREGREPDRLGNREPGTACSGVVATADGHVAFVARGPVQAARVAAVTGTAAYRGGAPDLDAIGRWAVDRTAGVVAAALRRAGARAEVVQTVRALWTAGVLARLGLTEELTHPVTGRRPYLRLPVMLDGRLLDSTAPAPTFDEHTDAVLVDWLGLPADRIAELRASAAVGTRPRQPRRRAGGGAPTDSPGA